MAADTLYLSVNYIDRYLSLRPVLRGNPSIQLSHSFSLSTFPLASINSHPLGCFPSLISLSSILGKLQLLGVVSMLVASKFEEVYAPAVDEFVYISDNTYTKEEVFHCPFIPSSIHRCLSLSIYASIYPLLINLSISFASSSLISW